MRKVRSAPRLTMMSQFRMLERVQDAHRKEAERAMLPKVVQRLACAEETEIQGAAASTGRLRAPCSFVVVARDERGRQMSRGGDRVRLSVSGPSQLRAGVADKGDGSYCVSYFANFPGTYQLVVTCNGRPVPSSPLSITIPMGGTVNPSATASRCTAEGEHMEKGLLCADSEFDVIVRDSAGERIGQGGDRVRVACHGPGPLRTSVTDHKDGKYTVLYHANVSGTYTLQVGCAGVWGAGAYGVDAWVVEAGTHV